MYTLSGLLESFGLTATPLNSLAAVLLVFGGFAGLDWESIRGDA